MPVTYDDEVVIIHTSPGIRIDTRCRAVNCTEVLPCRQAHVPAFYNLGLIDKRTPSPILARTGCNYLVGDMKNRRKITDRRSYDPEHNRNGTCNRRRFPDRRLNNILVEWIPLEMVHAHPVTQRVFQFSRRMFRSS